MRNAVFGSVMMALAALALQASGPQTLAADAEASAPAEGPGPQRNGPARQALAACRGDLQTLCGAVEAGGGRKINCLAQNQDKLSPGCKAAIGSVLGKSGRTLAAGPASAAAPEAGAAPQAGRALAPGRAAQGFGQVCKGDIASVCAGVEKGQGRIVKCLKENTARLSEPCQNFFAMRKVEKQAERQEVKAQCAGDRQICGEVLKGHDLIVCLRQSKAKLSPGCQQALAKLN